MSTAQLVTTGYRLAPQQARSYAFNRELDRPAAVHCIARTSGRIHVQQLEAALQQMIVRHEILRTTYRSAPGSDIAVQVIVPEVAIRPDVLDATGSADSELRNSRERWYAETLAASFDLEHGPALRCRLATFGDADSLIALSFPSVSADAESAVLCMREVMALLDGLPLPEPAAQYTQYAEYQIGWLDSDESVAGLEYWKAKRLPPSPRLSLATGSPLAGNVAIEVIDVALRGDAGERFEAAGVSVESALLACWARVLGAFGAAKEVVTGVATSGRNFEDVVAMPGTFVRHVPVVIPVGEDTSLTQLVRSCHAALAEQRQYAESVDAHTFDLPVQFEYLDTRDGNTVARWSIMDVRGRTAPFVYRCFALHTTEGIHLRFEYDPQVLEPAGARWIASALGSTIDAAARQPAEAISKLPLLGEADRAIVLDEWNRTAQTWRRGFAHELIAATAAENPDAIAITSESRKVTYGELQERVNGLCRVLREKGAAPEAIVAVCADPGVEAIAAILAVLQSGAAFLPLDPSYPPERLSYMLRDSGAAILISKTDSAGLVRDTVPWIDLEREWPAADAMHVPKITAGNLAYVIYTSGSTGLPKGTSITQGSLANYLSWCLQEYAGKDAAGAPLVSSLAFDLSITSLLAPLCAGQSVAVSRVSRVEALPELLRQNRDFNWVKLTPSHARMLAHQMQASELEGATRKVILGGEALAGRDYLFWSAASPGLDVINEYGPTEATVGCATFHANGAASPDQAIPIGTPIANAQLYVLDGNLDPVPPGVLGEIYIGGAGLARGYHRRPGLTAERFIPHPFSPAPGARLYRTGDLGSYRADGVLLFHGRSDQQVKIRGYRIELAEIEAALATHPRVRGAVLAVIGSDTESDRLAAYYVPAAEDDAGPPVSELQQWLAARLPEYMVPSVYIAVDEIPLTPNGKVDRAALPAPEGESTASSSFELPRTLEEEVLASIFANVLGLERVSVEENYFALGGDSIRAIRVIGRAAARGIHIRIEDLFRYQTVRSLARAVRQSRRGAAQLPRTAPFSLISAEDRAKLPPDAVDAYPLSRLQAGMLFHREYHPDSAIYHDIFGYHIRMPLDTDILRQAAAELVARHPAIRTSFHLGGFSEPIQIVHETAPNPLHVTDISHLSPEEQERAIQDWMEQEKRRGFAYDHAPLVKFHIHRRSQDTIQFSLSFHHAIIDGWSDASMLVQLAVSYYYQVLGKAPEIAAPQTLYRDFIALERQALESPEHQAFWMERLEWAESLVLPRWAPTPVVTPSTRGVYMQPVSIADDVSEALQQLSRSNAVPLKNVLLAAHMRVMSFLGGTRDVLTTISSAGRLETEDGDKVLGLHLNSTPFRLQIAAAPWNDLIQAALNAELDALPYRRFPMAEIQKLKGSRRISETSFYYTHYHVVGRLQELPDFEILGRIFYEETSFALVANFSLDPWSGKVMLGLACDRTQFTGRQMEFMAGCYERGLVHLARNPDASCDEVDLLGKSDARELGGLLSGPTLEEANFATVLEAIEDMSRAKPDHLALRCGGQTLTYGEMIERAQLVARRLAAKGVRIGDAVALFLPRSLDAVVAMVGVMKAGAAWLPVDPSYPDRRLGFVLGDSGASLALTTTALATHLPDEIDHLLLDDSSQDIAGDSDVAMRRITPADAAYCIYTSGSTGQPKGVSVTHFNLHASTVARLQYYSEPVGSWLLLPSFAFDSSVAGVFSTLSSGGTLVIATSDEQRDPVRIAALIEEAHITHLLCLPSVYASVLDSLQGRGTGLRAVIVAGEACPADLPARHFALLPEVALFNEYGPTEATVWCTVERCKAEYPEQRVPIGKPIPGATLHVLDETSLMPVPIGVPGELFVAGPGVAAGYIQRPALTAERFLPAPSGTRMYRTGDRVRLRPDGRLEFLGRVDQQVKIRGHRVEPGEIEAVIQEIPEVMECAVVVREDAGTGATLAAFVSVPVQRPELETRLRGHVEARLPSYMWPPFWSIVSELPRTPNGKLDRQSMKSHAVAPREDIAPYEAPRDPLEACLAGIWADVMKLSRVSVEDDFFALGGDSIVCIQLIAKAQDAGYRLMPAQIFEGRTIRRIASGLNKTDAVEPSAPPTPAGVSDAELQEFIGQITSNIESR